jgi:hypothetical protein
MKDWQLRAQHQWTISESGDDHLRTLSTLGSSAFA